LGRKAAPEIPRREDDKQVRRKEMIQHVQACANYERREEDQGSIALRHAQKMQQFPRWTRAATDHLWRRRPVRQKALPEDLWLPQ
jgi:hypothetical protein